MHQKRKSPVQPGKAGQGAINKLAHTDNRLGAVQDAEGELLDSPVVNAALKYARQGKPVFPVRITKKGTKEVKQPLIKGWQENASTDPDTIKEWFSRFPDALIGMPTGSKSGVWVLDIDPPIGGKADGFQSLETLIREHGELPSTRVHTSGRGGRHYFFLYEGEAASIRNSSSALGPSLDIRGESGYIIMAPSIRPDGGKYEVLQDGPTVAAPDWLVKLALNKGGEKPKPASKVQNPLCIIPNGWRGHPYINAAIECELDALGTAQPGTRNNILNRAAFSLGQWVGACLLDEAEAKDLLYQAATRCVLVADDGESSVYKTIASGLGKGKNKPRHVPASPMKGDRRNTDITYGADSTNGSPDAEQESRILPPPPPVPLDAFPAQVAVMLEEASEAFMVPMQIPTASLLGVLSCLVGGMRLISLRPSWKEPGNIWIATVADSGIGKTPCAAAFFSPIKRLEYEAFQQWKDEYASYEYELELVKKERGRAKRGEPIPDRPIKPKRRQAYIDDATVEALGEVLSENPRGIMWRKDELAGLIADLDKYSASNNGGGTRSRLLSSYDGQEWKTSRTSNPARNIYIPHAYVGIFGGIQPAMLPKVFEAGAAGVDEASGFLQRFILIRAEREKPSYWTERDLSQSSKDLLSSIVAALWAWNTEYDAETREIEKIVRVSDQAKAVFVEWFNGIAQEEFLSHNAALLSKLKGQAQRLCLLLHCLDAALVGNDGMALVTEDCMRRALLLADWIKEHQEQCWRFFSPDKKAKQATHIERAIMAVVVEEAARIEADGWRMKSADLHAKVKDKMGMKRVTKDKVAKAASSLGLGSCYMDKCRARSIPAETISSCKKAVVGVVAVEHHTDTRDSTATPAVTEVLYGVVIPTRAPAMATPSNTSITPAVADKTVEPQKQTTATTAITPAQEYNSAFDSNDLGYPGGDKAKI